MKKTVQKAAQILALLACCLFIAACGNLKKGSDSLLGEDFQIGALGCNAFISGDVGELDVPPDLAPPDDSQSLAVPTQGERVSMSSAAFDSYVLPARLDMRVHREGNVSWLSVDTEPASLWPALGEFLQDSGFTIVENDPTQGYIVTAWRNRRVPVSTDGEDYARMRTRVFVRVERDADAVTNVFFSAQDAGLQNGEWQLMPYDANLEHRILMRFRSQLARGREIANPRMASIDDVRTHLEINDFKGVAVLTIGQHYSKVWRRLGVALGRSGIKVRADSRSRGIYRIKYNMYDNSFNADGGATDSRLLQLHLLAKGDGETLITVHPDDKSAPLSYDDAHSVLKRLVMSYSPRRTTAG